MKSVTIVGAGAVGRSIALALFHSKVKIVGIYSGNGKSAKTLAKKVHCANSGKFTPDTVLSDIVIISVPDHRIRDVAESLAQNTASLKRKIIFHTSGALTSDELLLLKEKGAAIASFHPLQTFSRSKNITSLKNVWCAVEGDRKAVAVAHTVGKKLQLNVFTITKKNKSLYHASAVFASNYIVTLLSVVEKISEHIHIPKRNIWKIYGPLIHQTIENAMTLSPASALTGPIVRGDIVTIKKHLDALSQPKLKNFVELYSVLGIETARLIKGKNAR